MRFVSSNTKATRVVMPERTHVTMMRIVMVAHTVAVFKVTVILFGNKERAMIMQEFARIMTYPQVVTMDSPWIVDSYA